jgi:hypothetical protein
MQWLHHHKKVPGGPIRRSSQREADSISKLPTSEVFNTTIDEVDYAKEFEKWPIANLANYEVLEFEWEGFGGMFLGLTIVNKYDNRGIFVKRVDPDGAGGQYG